MTLKCIKCVYIILTIMRHESDNVLLDKVNVIFFKTLRMCKLWYHWLKNVSKCWYIKIDSINKTMNDNEIWFENDNEMMLSIE